MTTPESDAYWGGYRAARAGRKKSPPSTLSWKDRHWWLGGYSDWEIENVVDSKTTKA